MYKALPILSLVIALSTSACSPEKASPQAAKVEIETIPPSVAVAASAATVAAIVPPARQSSDQVKVVAREYGVSEAKVEDTASRAAEMSGGNASKQDMLDALKAATGK